MQKIIRTRDMDWKQWNLRIPLVLFLFGATAALYQSFPNLFLVESGFFVSAQYIGGIVLLFMLFEKIGLNQKKIHFTFGILLILTGLLMDIIFI
ncbi:hypothetical protein [Psychrobacillus sp. OK032]|uniref:hypothetical protein n=1 Tax=Psychrobacillus sp. OK032 TaxID=1884358 RepID=UPI0008C60746|nr:hypothetical protein [Psychrobacillus sp. OK032]SES44484.1 hypothetical protein SAMN05518872_11424 [Psychrobacillus sp. OK032]